MIESIEGEITWNGRGDEPLWFHPRACRIPPEKPNAPPSVFLTAQGISGSDYFHPVNWMQSSDLGKSWATPKPVPGFGRETWPDTEELGKGIEKGVCNVVPERHTLTNRVL